MMKIIKNSLTAARILGLFSLLGLGLVAFIFSQTKDQISQNERDDLLRSLKTVVPAALYDNDIVNDTKVVTDLLSETSKSPSTIYRARKNSEPVAAVITTIAPDGYNGNIYLLVAIKVDGTLSGVRVVSHKETPGLGDNIEPARSDWILSFNGKSLNNLSEKEWAVKRDGGAFDQFTGATITPRAVVKAVNNALHYFEKNKTQIFAVEEEAGE